MASYEDAAGIDSIISDSVAAGEISQETATAIQELVNSLGTDARAQTVAAGATLTDATVEAATPIIIMNADSKADVTFAADSDVKAIVVGGAGDSNVVFETSDDVTVQLQGGSGDSVSTGAGSDTITFTGGSATINTGDGKDTVVLQGKTEGETAQATVIMGDGNGTINIVPGLVGSASIDAGDGFDQVNMISSRLDHVFQFINGIFTMHSDAELSMQNVNIVTFDETGDGVTDAITVLADSAGDAITAKLYQVAFGREALDGADGTNGLTGDQAVTGVLGGISYWTSVFDQGTNTGADLQHTVYSFLNCDEFHNKYDAMSDAQFVQTLLDNLGAANDTTVTTVNGLTAADLVAQLNGTQEARYNVAWTVASSQQAVQILGQNGINFVIDGFEGTDTPSA